MDFRLIAKDMIILFRNRAALLTVAAVYFLETSLLFYTHNIFINDGIASALMQLTFLRNHLLIFFMPVVIVCILTVAFSLSQEKENFLLAAMIPFGKSTFLRSKVIVSIIFSVMLTFPYLGCVILLNGLTVFSGTGFIYSGIFYLFFVIAGICTFSIFFAVRFYDPGNNFEPKVPGMIALMFLISLIVVASFVLLSWNLLTYYEYIMCYRLKYPNIEFIVMLSAAYSFWFVSRYLLRSVENPDKTGN